jgi:hypothetical protein
MEVNAKQHIKVVLSEETIREIVVEYFWKQYGMSPNQTLKDGELCEPDFSAVARYTNDNSLHPIRDERPMDAAMLTLIKEARNPMLIRRREAIERGEEETVGLPR